MKKIVNILFVLIIISLASLSYFIYYNINKNQPDTVPGLPYRPEPGQAADASFAVSAGHPLAVEAGLQILEKGGNAVDAAAAVAYALAVVEPQGSGLGGGGIMLIHLAAENTQVVVDYRETAPTMEPDHVARALAYPSFGIPGFVRGLEKAVSEYGKLTYAEVIEPAYSLANDGFPVSRELASRLRGNSQKLARGQTARKDFFRSGRTLSQGQILTQPTLAKTLRAIMEQGSTVFYEGYIADSIIETMRRNNLPLPKSDLANYAPVIREPLSAGYRDYTVVTVPPPAGGFNLLQQLLILNHFALNEPTPETFHLLEQTINATYSDRRSYIGDPNFVNAPVEELLSPDYIAGKVEQIKEGPIEASHFTDAILPSDNTTHITVVDAEGNWVSVTNTISIYFGYGLQAEGFFLNTQLNNFSDRPTSPNYYRAGKRPFSHISPAIILKDGTPVLALGTPGGRRIPALLVQVLIHHLDFGLPLSEAVDQPRFWAENNTLYAEKGLASEVITHFRKQGYQVVQQNPDYFFGRVSAIARDPATGFLTGSADPLRGEGLFIATGFSAE